MYLNCFAQVFPSRYSLYIYIFWTQYSILLRNFQKRQLIKGEPEEENREFWGMFIHVLPSCMNLHMVH